MIHLDPSGKMKRLPYFFVVLSLNIVLSILSEIDKEQAVGPIPALLTLPPLFYVWSVAGIMRAHDIGRSGWYSLWQYIPIACLFLIFRRSQQPIHVHEVAQPLPEEPWTI